MYSKKKIKPNIIFAGISLALVFFTISPNGQCQREASNWYFGDAGLKFDATGVRPSTDGNMYYAFGYGSSISDENGKLLFYTNGDTVYNRQHQRMSNGSGLTGLGAPTICVVVPNPSNNGIYYIFVADRGKAFVPSALSYSTVDLSLNGGLGEVTAKRHVLFTPVAGVLAAILHANGKDIWVVTHEFNTNRFFSYLVTSSGVSETPIVSTIGATHWVYYDKQMQFSPDGDKVAVTCSPLTANYNSILELFNFSVVTGKVSNPIFSVSYLTDPRRFRSPSGLEFSPDGRYLYSSNIGSSGEAKIFQFDISLGNQSSILNSTIEVGIPQDGLEMNLQLGPNGKIYIVHGGGLSRSNLSSIDAPNSKGLACKYVEGGVDLAGKFGCSSYLPIFVRNYTTPPASFTSSSLCVLDSTVFYPTSLGYYDSLVWDFGDPSSGAFNRSKVKQAKHKFSADGSYNVSLTTYFDGAARRKVTQQIVLNKMPLVELGKDATICDGSQVVLSVPSGFSQKWSTGDTGSSITVTKTGLYKVSFTNGQCALQDSINIKVLDQPKVNFPDILVVCTESEILDSRSPKFNVLWSTGETTSTIRVNQTGKYGVRITNDICIARDTVFVQMGRVADLIASASKDSVGYNDNLVFTASASNIKQWLWNFGDGSQSNERITNHTYQIEGSYEPKITATNMFGCKDSVSIKVFVKRVLFIPNVFTPNGDGKNDSFTVQFNGDQDYGLIICNRWGQEIHRSYGSQNQWSGDSQEAGIYYYLVTIGSEKFKGWVQLIR